MELLRKRCVMIAIYFPLENFPGHLIPKNIYLLQEKAQRVKYAENKSEKTESSIFSMQKKKKTKRGVCHLDNSPNDIEQKEHKKLKSIRKSLLIFKMFVIWKNCIRTQNCIHQNIKISSH